MKNVGGVYLSLFASHIVVAFKRVFSEVNQIACTTYKLLFNHNYLKQVNELDKARLDFLLSTWEEGALFNRDILFAMRSYIGTRIVCSRPQVFLCATLIITFHVTNYVARSLIARKG